MLEIDIDMKRRASRREQIWFNGQFASSLIFVEKELCHEAVIKLFDF